MLKLRRTFAFAILLKSRDWGRKRAIIIACVHPLQKPGDSVFIPVFQSDFMLKAIFPAPFDESFQALGFA